MNEEKSNIEKMMAMEEKEPVAGFLGIKLEEVSPGFARVVMPMRPEYINFNGMVFGGIVMSVADQAFAYATNAVTSPNLAIQFNINLISAVSADDVLTAECRVIKAGKRISVAEMKVTSQAGRLIATATGTTMYTG